jgi:threonine synthase
MEPATGATFAGLFKLIASHVIAPDDVVIVNCAGHTLPVQEELLPKSWAHNLDTASSTTASSTTASGTPGKPQSTASQYAAPLPQEEGLLAALERLDERVKSIIVIDDDDNARRLLKRILQARGKYILYEAENGRAGLDVIRRERPDMVLVDLMMPELDGFGLLQIMKADDALKDIPVIVVSAKELTPTERKRLAGQVESLLQKGSFTDLDLLGDIESALV